MKPDLELQRKILLDLEKSNSDLVFTPLDRPEFGYQVRLLEDKGVFRQTGTSTYRLTNFGQEYLETIRNIKSEKPQESEETSGLMKKIARWWNGRYEPWRTPGIFGINHERHWTSNAAHWIVDFYLRNWQWIIGTIIAIILGVLAL